MENISYTISYKRQDNTIGAVIGFPDNHEKYLKMSEHDINYFLDLDYTITEFTVNVRCEHCGGHGKIYDKRVKVITWATKSKPCKKCFGTGKSKEISLEKPEENLRKNSDLKTLIEKLLH